MEACRFEEDDSEGDDGRSPAEEEDPRGSLKYSWLMANYDHKRLLTIS